MFRKDKAEDLEEIKLYNLAIAILIMLVVAELIVFVGWVL